MKTTFTPTFELAASRVASRKVVNKPGKANLQVVSVNHYDGKVIVGFKAHTSAKRQEAMQLLREGKLVEAINTNLSASLLPSQYIPTKGEVVAVITEMVTARNGSKIIGVSSVSPIPAEELTTQGLDEDLANMLDEARAKAKTVSASAEPALD